MQKMGAGNDGSVSLSGCRLRALRVRLQRSHEGFRHHSEWPWRCSGVLFPPKGLVRLRKHSICFGDKHVSVGGVEHLA